MQVRWRRPKTHQTTTEQQQEQQVQQPDKAVAGLLLFVLPTFVRSFPNDAQVSEDNAIN